MGSAARVGLVFVAGSLAVLIGSCRGATEILLDLHTNIPCSGAAPWHGVAIYTGRPGIDVETRAPTTTTMTCGADGEIGTLAVVPNESNDAEIGLRIVAGITRAPEDCAAHGYEGCVVARRTLSFLPHETLPLTINLDSECTGLGCDALHSCTNGSCADSRVTPDAPAPDAGPTMTTGPVRCGDDGVTCPTEGDTCCLLVDVDAGATHGECKPAKLCSPKRLVLACDANEQCPGADDAGSPNVCCLLYDGAVKAADDTPDRITSSACMAFSKCMGTNQAGLFTYGLCNDRKVCPGGFGCGGATDRLPGYFWCRFN